MNALNIQKAASSVIDSTDVSGRGIIFIDTIHSRVHDGVHFTVAKDFTLNAAETGEVVMTTASSSEVHLQVVFDSNLTGAYIMSEGPTFSGGTAIVPVNNNRKSSNTPNSTLVHTPSSVSDVGTTLESGVVGAGSAVFLGGEEGNRHEWLLAQDTSYLMRFTAAADNTVAYVKIYWYEVG